MKKLLFFTLLAFPAVSFAQNIQSSLVGVSVLINNFIIPFLVSLAVLAFIYNTVKYFIIQSSEEQGREKAKRFMLYSILAFVIIVSLWGIVNFVITGLGFGDCPPIEPDYIRSSGAMNPCTTPITPGG